MEGAQHWRRTRSDELEVEELYVTEENCKLLLNDNRCCFQQYGVFATKFFESSGIAQWYSGARMMSRNAGRQVTTRVSEQI